jgi:Ca-activated chloride channel homolog
MIQFEHMSGWQALALFAALAVPTVWLGLTRLAALGRVRQRVAIVTRLLLIGLAILMLAGLRLNRTNENVEVMVLRDVSDSTRLVRLQSGQNVRKSLDEFLLESYQTDADRRGDDRLGVISFDRQAYVDEIASNQPTLASRVVREGTEGTDVAGAIQLALATLSKEAMQRIVLVWDGNQTIGDLDAALRQAAAKKVPIDVIPLEYEAREEVLLERFVAPPSRRENEPFTLDVVLKSTNRSDVTGNLSVLHQGEAMDLDPATPGVQPTRRVTLSPGPNVHRVQVPALKEAGVHQFKALFEAPNVSADVAGASKVDTLLANNIANTFTFVRGKGRVLLIENIPGGGGRFLRQALAREGIEIDPVRDSADEFPTSLVELQNYDSVILANVPRGPGGLAEDQQAMLANYVRDMGGGLVMIGGEEAFGAGGWQGSKLADVLPVEMEIPAQRQIPKGALVLLMHSCEMADGNYWGIQCASKAVEVLSPRDEVGVLSYGWRNRGGSQWDFPLADRGDGSKVLQAIKNMQLGDMPDFDEALNLALNGEPGRPGLKQSDARQKHVIIISDGDPQPPTDALIRDYKDSRVSISTVSVFPHQRPIPQTMRVLAEVTGGRAYGPIESDPSQLPQIFVKEATVVRRSLIFEKREGIAVKNAGASEWVKGIDLNSLPPVFGIVLTGRKESPQIEMPLVVGDNNDPLLAHWQVGLGKAAVFTSDAHNRWAANWVAMNAYDKFWAQLVRSVSKPAESSDFDVRVNVTGDVGKIVVEAVDPDSAFQNFLNIRGSVVGPDMQAREVRLNQVGPGVYEAEFKAGDAGNYVAALAYQASDGKAGVLRSGTVVNTGPEMRDLRSNMTAISDVATRTGGRVLKLFDPANPSFYTRQGLEPSISPLPIWDRLLPWLIALLIVDIAVRRIAWDVAMFRQAWNAVLGRVRAVTTTRQVETTQSIDALRDIRTRGGQTQTSATTPATTSGEPQQPVSTRKFEAAGSVQGNLADVVGGATDKPLPKAAPSSTPPKGQQPEPGGIGSLMEAKRRAQEKIREREEGKS